MTLPDARALDDPIIRGLNHLFQISVGQKTRGDVGSKGRDFRPYKVRQKSFSKLREGKPYIVSGFSWNWNGLCPIETHKDRKRKDEAGLLFACGSNGLQNSLKETFYQRLVKSDSKQTRVRPTCMPSPLFQGRKIISTEKGL
jgi:hypothetical protein